MPIGGMKEVMKNNLIHDQILPSDDPWKISLGRKNISEAEGDEDRFEVVVGFDPELGKPEKSPGPLVKLQSLLEFSFFVQQSGLNLWTKI